MWRYKRLYQHCYICENELPPKKKLLCGDDKCFKEYEKIRRRPYGRALNKNPLYRQQQKEYFRNKYKNDLEWRQSRLDRARKYTRDKKGYVENPVCIDCNDPVIRKSHYRPPDRCKPCGKIRTRQINTAYMRKWRAKRDAA